MLKLTSRFRLFSIFLVFAVSACTSVPSKTGGAKTEVALLLPLSGEQATVGVRLEKAIRKGFLDAGAQNISINSYDASSEAILAKSLSKVLSRNSKVIIGPLFSRDSKLTANRTRGSDATVLSFSNDPSLANNNIFVCGHAPKFQTTRLLQYFLSQGYTNFITLMPSGPNFQKTNQEVQALIVQNNATHVRSEFYLNNNEGINSAVRNVAMAVDRLNEDEQNMKRPVVLVVEDPRNFDYLLSAIEESGVDKKAEIISDWRINIPASHRLVYSFTGSSKMTESDAHSLQVAVNSKYPSALEFIAYDLPHAIVGAIGQKYNKEQFQRTLMTVPVEGLGGKLKFRGFIATRPYDIIKHNAGSFEVLEVAQ
jgi:LppC putative lipoprotein